MLYLTRRPGESILVGDDVEITISAMQRGQVRLGIEAPHHISVDRKEIREKKNSQVGDFDGGYSK